MVKELAKLVSDLQTSATFMFKAEPGTDVTGSLQSALSRYKRVAIDANYIISDALNIDTDGTLIAASKDASLTAAELRKGLLKSTGTYINVKGKKNVQVKGITLKAATNMTNMSELARDGFGAAIISINSGSVNCTVDYCKFDFDYEYGKGGINGVLITGPKTRQNIVSHCTMNTVGITYCEDGASFNTCEYNKVYNASWNAIGGIGNNHKAACKDNVVRYNYIENAGRMGIEEIQRVIGSVIYKNEVRGAGKYKPFGDNGQGYGISSVAERSVVSWNIIRDVAGVHLEIRGGAGHIFHNNDIEGAGEDHGVTINFTAPAANSAQTTTYGHNNIIEGCKYCMETLGDDCDQQISLNDNIIINPSERGINIDLNNGLNPSIDLNGNVFLFTRQGGDRTALLVTSSRPVGKLKGKIRMSGDQFIYADKAVGKSYDTVLGLFCDNVELSEITIDGYPTNRFIPFRTYLQRTGYNVGQIELSNTDQSFDMKLLPADKNVI